MLLAHQIDRNKKMCHINMLKEYHERCDRNLVKPVSFFANVKRVQNCIESDMVIDINKKDCNQSACLQNSTIFANFDTKVGHLSIHQKEQVKKLVDEYYQLFSDVPKKPNAAVMNVIVGDALPIKQHPYRLNPIKLQYLRREVQYMLDNDIIKPSKNNWTSPFILVPNRMVLIDYAPILEK